MIWNVSAILYAVTCVIIQEVGEKGKGRGFNLLFILFYPIVSTSYDLPKITISICDANPLLCDPFTYEILMGNWTLQ